MAKEKSKSSNSAWAKFKRYLPLYLMFLPGGIYLFINNYIPMAGIIVAFKNYNARQGIWKSAWAGFKNFQFLFATPDAWVITRNTILYNVAFIIVNTLLGIIFAIFICDCVNEKLKKTYQSAILFPYLMSAVILGYIVFAFLSQSTGIVNNTILPALGLEPVDWYSQSKYWPFILIFVNTWKGVGYGTLIYISAINGIDPSLYEAAEIDGASQFTIFSKIVLPLGKPILVTMGTFAGLGYWNDWTNGLYYIVQDKTKYNIQNLLNNMVQNIQYLAQSSNSNVSGAAAAIPTTGVQMAIAFVAILPIMLIFPLFSKYYAAGITLGAVKG